MANYEYYGDYSSIEEALEGMLGMSLASNMWSSLVSLATYVFMAIGLYAIAKRRGIRHPWMGWVPFANVWLLGCISDQYRYVAHGQEKSKRKVMLGLDIATAALGVVAIVLVVVGLISMFSRMDSHLGMLEEELIMNDASYFADVLGPMMIAVVLCLVMLGTAIALTVLQYMALYDLFNSCNPATSAVFLALSIVLTLFGFGIVQAIFVFACRNKDLGMPVRQTPMMYAQQPTWQPQQPPVEPWEHNDDPWHRNSDF